MQLLYRCVQRAMSGNRKLLSHQHPPRLRAAQSRSQSTPNQSRCAVKTASQPTKLPP